MSDLAATGRREIRPTPPDNIAAKINAALDEYAEWLARINHPSTHKDTTS